MSRAVLTLDLGDGSNVNQKTVEMLRNCIDAAPGDVLVHVKCGNTLMVLPETRRVAVGPKLLSVLGALCKPRGWSFTVDGAPPPPRRAAKAGPPPARRKS